ncbi:Mgp12 protein [Maudiozyma humilis]|uniref:Glutaredoxin-like protein n=1 Tax=Maudiozyma humilis TaxID=51915 RepID=A0AAV5SCC3_MAUHU|nr:Mgp12 protein [Kazachstania humilis]
MLRVRPVTFARAIHSGRILYNYNQLKLTLFSKPNCGLCEEAKEILVDTLELPVFKGEKLQEKLNEVNINKDAKWWKEYCFDIPVLHIEKEGEPESLVKIMHFFKEDELTEAIKKFK